jgi:hypothetical protein
MKRSGNSRTRARRRVAVAAGFLVIFAMGGATRAAAQTEFGGFQVGSSAAAISIVYNQPSFGISTAPCPTFPFDLSRTTAFSDAASGHALGSVAWPCDFFANALPLLGEMIPPPFGPQDIPAYPVRAETFYPQGPTNQETGAPLAHMSASSVEGASLGSANFGSLTFPGIIVASNVTSTSQANRTPNGTIATATSAMHDVDILEGTVHFDSIKSVVTAESNSETAEVSGGVTYAGLTVLGQPAVIDAEGIHFQPQPPASSSNGGGLPGGGKTKKTSPVAAQASPSPTPSPSASPSPTASPPPEDGPVGEIVNPIYEQLVKQLQTQLERMGIEFQPSTTIDVVEGASGSREVSGIQITLKGETAQPYVDRLPKPIQDQIEQAICDPSGNVCVNFPFDGVFTLYLGSASAKAAASPAFAAPPLVPPILPGATGGIFPPVDFGNPGTLPPSQGPAILPTVNLGDARGIPISALLVALALGIAAVAAGGLRRFAEAATTAAFVERCELEKT